MTGSTLNVVELYAGTARSSEPFKRWRRARLGLLVDNDKYVAKTHIANCPSAPYAVRNLSHVSARWIEEQSGGPVDVLLGCPPCQGFSDNGYRDPDDVRNAHLLNFARLAVGLCPQAIAMENVPLAVSSPQFGRFVKRIERAGYFWTAGILNAALYGSCQCRQRLIFVAIRSDIGWEPVLPDPTHGSNRAYFSYSHRRMMKLSEARVAILGVTPCDVPDARPTSVPRGGTRLHEDPNGRRYTPRAPCHRHGARAMDMAHIPWAHSPAQRRRMGRLIEGGQARRSTKYYSSSYGRLHRSGLARTITGAFPNAGSGRNWHPIENRTLTLREAARIQGFADNYAFNRPYSKATQVSGMPSTPVSQV